MKNNQQNHIGTFLYLTQIKAVLFAIISATSYYRFLDFTPFEIIMVFTVSNSTTCTRTRKYRCMWINLHVWQPASVHDEEAHGVSIS